MKNYVNPAETQEQYKAWHKAWQPPANMPRAMKGKSIVEFAPFQCSGMFYRPEDTSKTAMMVHDYAGDVPVGTEVVIGTIHGTEFTHEGRRFTIVDQSDILLMEVAA